MVIGLPAICIFSVYATKKNFKYDEGILLYTIYTRLYMYIDIIIIITTIIMPMFKIHCYNSTVIILYRAA